MSIISAVSANIRVELARGGITQESLAAGIYKNADSLSRQPRGLQEFKLSDLEKIADFLNVEVADLFIPQTRKNVHETSGAASLATRFEEPLKRKLSLKKMDYQFYLPMSLEI